MDVHVGISCFFTVDAYSLPFFDVFFSSMSGTPLVHDLPPVNGKEYRTIQGKSYKRTITAPAYKGPLSNSLFFAQIYQHQVSLKPWL